MSILVRSMSPEEFYPPDLQAGRTMTQVVDATKHTLDRLRAVCEEAEGKDKAVLTDPEKVLWLLDKIEGLQADLDSAVETAFKRGATDWCRLNYPDQFRRLMTAQGSPDVHQRS